MQALGSGKSQFIRIAKAKTDPIHQRPFKGSQYLFVAHGLAWKGARLTTLLTEGWDCMKRRKKQFKIFFLLVSVLTITLFHYVTELRTHHYHLVYQGVYFLPIMLAGFWFGLRGSLGTSLSITLLYIPFTLMHWEGFPGGDFNNVMEMVLYNAVGMILGILRDRERAVQRRLREFESLASIGKAFFGLVHDMKTPLIAIGGIIRLFRRSLEKGSPDVRKLDIVIEETQRSEYMVKEMLDFSRPLQLLFYW